jgi:hypothetical protein
MIEVFKTNVNKKQEADRLVKALLLAMPGYLFCFDLEDCDRILKVRAADDQLDNRHVIQLLNENNYTCTFLEEENN